MAARENTASQGVPQLAGEIFTRASADPTLSLHDVSKTRG